MRFIISACGATTPKEISDKEKKMKYLKTCVKILNGILAALFGRPEKKKRAKKIDLYRCNVGYNYL